MQTLKSSQTSCFTLVLHTFQRNLKNMFFDYSDVNFNARLSLLNQHAIFQNRVIGEYK